MGTPANTPDPFEAKFGEVLQVIDSQVALPRFLLHLPVGYPSRNLLKQKIMKGNTYHPLVSP